MDDEVGVIPPPEMLVRLERGAGDLLHALARPDGYLLCARDPDTLRQIELGAEFMSENEPALAKLAKS